MGSEQFDVVVVGGGSAGCVLAGRLTADPARRVLVLEAGPAGPLPRTLCDAASLAATAPGHELNWAYSAELRTGHTAVVPRGRVLGGSSAINGANWVRATPADCAGWGPGWSYTELLPYYVRAETDRDFAGPLKPPARSAEPKPGDPSDAPRPVQASCAVSGAPAAVTAVAAHGSGHGRRGPIPVCRPHGELLHPAAERFLDASGRLGFPIEADKNGGGPPGAGLVPSNIDGGLRVDAATAYLRPHLHRLNLTVRGDAVVHRVLLDGDRCVGVELLDGTRFEAGEVVLAAGAVGTPHLLLRSGIGPADELHAAGVDVRHDLPGVGRGWSDHPAVFLPFAAGDPPAHPHAASSQAALNLDAGADPAGDVEVLLFVRPFATSPSAGGAVGIERSASGAVDLRRSAGGGVGTGGDLHLMCLLQHPDSRGVITLTSPDPQVPPRIEYRYLRTEHDRRRLRHAIRTAAELLRPGSAAAAHPAATSWATTARSTAGSPHTSRPPSTSAGAPPSARSVPGSSTRPCGSTACAACGSPTRRSYPPLPAEARPPPPSRSVRKPPPCSPRRRRRLAMPAPASIMGSRS